METNVMSARQPAQDWVQACAELSTREGDLSPEDLERYSIAAHLLGKDEQAYQLLDRAQTSWCDAQSGLMPYRSECQVHRAEIFQLRGSWAEATEGRLRLVNVSRPRASLRAARTLGSPSSIDYAVSWTWPNASMPLRQSPLLLPRSRSGWLPGSSMPQPCARRP